MHDHNEDRWERGWRNFERMYAAWWDRVSKHDAKARLARSVDRYIAAIS